MQVDNDDLSASVIPLISWSDVLTNINKRPWDGQIFSFWEAFKRRRSVREYDCRYLQIDTLGLILQAAYGINMIDQFSGKKCFRRAVPSAGGTYHLDLYLHAERINGLRDGLYLYKPIQNSLHLLRYLERNAFDGCILNPHLYANSNCIIIIASDLERILEVYGPRGYRYSLIEVGHVGQNICLAACTLGLSSLCIGGFDDVKLNGVIGLDGKAKATIYCLCVGYERRPPP